LAEAIGVSHMTIDRARKSGATVTFVTVEKHIGLDGKKRASRKPSPQRDKVQSAVDEMVRDGKPVSRTELAKKFGVSEHVVQDAA
jgi:hypothetical protein